MWRFDNNGNVPKVEDHSADVTNATPATIDIDYILAELSREYYGESMRWFDLVRTQKWAEFASTYRICGSNYGDHTPQTFTRRYSEPIFISVLFLKARLMVWKQPMKKKPLIKTRDIIKTYSAK